MLIDWFTVIAQIINFLILLFFLRLFLYRPVLKAMNEREQKITQRLREAEQREAEARREAEDFLRRTEELQAERHALLEEARVEAEARRKELMEKARHEADQARARWRQAVQQEKEALIRLLHQRAGSQMAAIARQALSDLANADLERHIIQVFVERLQELDGAVRLALEEVIREPDQQIEVRSAFEIPAELRSRIAEAVSDHMVRQNELSFVTDPQVICGIELRLPGQKIAWSLQSYLETLEESLAEALADRVLEKA